MSEILTREQYERIVQSARDNAWVPGMGASSLWQVANAYGAALDALDAALEALRTIADELEADSDYMNLSEIARAALAATRTPDAAVLEGETK